MTSQTQTAEAFAPLHAAPEILILPNAWDAASAALMEMAGAAAVAHLQRRRRLEPRVPDGNALPVDRLISTLEAITRTISVPLTADIEGGYSDDPIRCGRRSPGSSAPAPWDQHRGRRQRPDVLARKIEAARGAADAAGVALFVNARIDVYLHRLAEGEAALNETLSRARRYQDAGADGIFVPGPTAPELVGRLAREIALPLNVMGRAGAPTAKALQDLGVAR